MAPPPLTTRKKLKKFLEKVEVEAFIIGVVILYSFVIFFQLIFDEDASVMTEEVAHVLQIIDLAFLVVFLAEILVKLYAFGYAFVKDPYNLVDAIVVVASFVLTLVAIAAGGSVAEQGGLLRILRLARIFRVILIMNKIQRSRESAALLRKRAQYRKIGAPVEKVLETLMEMKERVDQTSEQDNLAWIIEIIASDQLYTVNINQTDGDNDVDNEMSAWLNQNANLQKKSSGAKEKGGDLENDDGDLPNAVNGGQRAGAANNTNEHTEFDELSNELKECIKKIHQWQFDIFELNRKADNKPLVVAAYQLTQEYGLFEEFDINKGKFIAFWTKIQAGYKHNPYHNSIHAADVLVSTNYYITYMAGRYGSSRCLPDKSILQPIDILGGLISGGIHDYEHPGVNNAFLQNTKGELAVLYNDMSILENHHVAAAFRLLLQEETSFLEHLAPDLYTDIRETIISAVLGTDMKHHFEHLTKFKTKMASDAFSNAANDKKDMRLLMMMAVHCADTSNPLKPFPTSLEWSMRVMEEFFMQGDQELERKLTVSPFMDRAKTSVAQCQIGFINVLVKPLHIEFCTYLDSQCVASGQVVPPHEEGGGVASQDCIEQVKQNVSKWEKEGNNLCDRDFSKANPEFLAAKEADAAAAAAAKAAAAHTAAHST